MGRPRILLVPALTELEWPIREQLEPWADVASFDAPGIGSEPAAAEPSVAGIVERGLAELDGRGWKRCFVVGDEFGSIIALHLAAARPAAVAGLVLGHACLRFPEGLNQEVMSSFGHLLRVDYRTYIRHLTQVTRGAYDDAFAERYMERVPQEAALGYEGVNVRDAGDLKSLATGLAAPLLLVKHEGCLGFSDEGFAGAAAALPHARTAATEVKPSASEEFAEVLRAFCTDVEGQPR